MAQTDIKTLSTDLMVSVKYIFRIYGFWLRDYKTILICSDIVGKIVLCLPLIWFV